MKYEKFEEWMVGKTVLYNNKDKGVVTREHDKSDRRVWVEWDDIGEAWAWVDSLVFLDVDEGHEPEQENKPIPWEVGQEVWDTSYGRGVVYAVFHSSSHTAAQIQVEFDSAKGCKVLYTLDGKYALGEGVTHRTLFFSEPTIIADTMPPKKVFKPTLKEGDEVVVRMVSGSISAFIVEKELEDYIKFKDVDYFLYKKRIASINKFGEQIKVEGVK